MTQIIPKETSHEHLPIPPGFPISVILRILVSREAYATVEVALHIYLATGDLKRLGQATGSHAFTVSASPAVSSS